MALTVEKIWIETIGAPFNSQFVKVRLSSGVRTYVLLQDSTLDSMADSLRDLAGILGNYTFGGESIE